MITTALIKIKINQHTKDNNEGQNKHSNQLNHNYSQSHVQIMVI